MSNPALTNIVEQAVLSQMRAKVSFTSLDISNALKAECYPVAHRDVAAQVRDIFGSGAMTHYDYARELIPVMAGGTSARAFLYHWEEVRPRTYQDRRQTALPPVPAGQARDLPDPAAPGPMPLLPRPVRAARPPSSRRPRVRRDGALAIPRRLLAGLGWADGLALSVIEEADRLVLSPAPPDDPARLRVWGGQRLRVCRTTLRRGALSAESAAFTIIEGKIVCQPK